VFACDFEVNKFKNLSPQEAERAQILYAAISRSHSTGEIPEDIGFGDSMKKSYPWAPFPVKSLPGWRGDKSVSNNTHLDETDWFIKWWDLAGQRPTTARKSDKIGSTGMTQKEIDAEFQHLFLPIIALFVVKVHWEGRIPPQLKARLSQRQDTEMGDAVTEDTDEIARTTSTDETADEGSPSEFSGMEE
jgi:hypothetical protein